MTPQKDSPQGITIGGRRFMAVQEGTLRHDLRYMELVSQLGLQSLQMREGEAPEEFAVRLLGELVAAGVVLELLGTLLIPEGRSAEEWTPEMAGETAAFFSGLTKPEDKAAVHAQVITLVLDFFERGMVALWTSRRSSSAVHPEGPSEGPIATVSGGR